MKLGSTINVMNNYKTTFHIANTTSITLLATGDFMCLCGTSVEAREQLRRDVILLPLLGSDQTGHQA